MDSYTGEACQTRAIIFLKHRSLERIQNDLMKQDLKFYQKHSLANFILLKMLFFKDLILFKKKTNDRVQIAHKARMAALLLNILNPSCSTKEF